MPMEIERRFFVINDTWKPYVFAQSNIEQYYLSTDKDHYTLRIRFKNDEAFLTIKGHSQTTSHSEFEYIIPLDDAIKMKNELKIGYGIKKIRYDVMYDNQHWEIDCFEDENAPLKVAEIEFKSEITTLEKLPPWVGKEIVYGDRLSNAVLARTPYSLLRDSFIHFEAENSIE